MPVEELISDDVAYPPKFGSPTSNAIRVGDFIYVSGMIAWDKDRKLVGLGDVKAQTRQVLKNMEAMLKAGGGRFQNIVKITFYLTDVRDKMAIWDVRKEMFGDARPASTLVEVVHLVDQNALLEVDCVAYVGK